MQFTYFGICLAICLIIYFKVKVLQIYLKDFPYLQTYLHLKSLLYNNNKLKSNANQ